MISKSVTRQLLKVLKTHYATILIVLILLVAAVLRLHNLSSIPPPLNQDEAVNGYDAYSIGHTLRDHHGVLLPRVLTSFGDTASPALTYLTIPFVLVFGLSTLSVRLPIALFGTLSVLLVYLLIKEFSKNRNLALLGALLIAISPWAITSSRWAVPPSIVPFAILLFLWLACLSIYRKRFTNTFLCLTGLAAALLTYSYQTTEIITPFLVIALGLIYFRKNVRNLLTLLITYFICVAPLYYQVLFTPKTSFTRLGQVVIPYHGIKFIEAAATRYFGYFTYSFYFGSKSNNIEMHVPGVGNFYSFLVLFLVVPIIVLLIYLSRRSRFKENIRHFISTLDIRLLIFGFICLILSPIPASITITKEYDERASVIFPLVLILLTYGIYYTFKFLPKYLKQLAYGLFLIAIVVSLLNFEKIYQNQYPQVAEPYFQYWLSESMQYVVSHQNNYKSIIFNSGSSTEPFTYIYYLFYSSYNPHKLNYSEINVSLTKHWSTYEVPKYGKLQFEPVYPAMLIGAKYLGSIKRHEQVLSYIYSKDGTLIIV